MSLQEFKDSHGSYYQLNNIKDKPITIFIHGVGLDNTMWYPQKKFFSSKPVLFYDLINHGKSNGGYKKLNFEILSNQLLNSFSKLISNLFFLRLITSNFFLYILSIITVSHFEIKGFLLL